LLITEGSAPPLYAFIMSIYTIDITRLTTGMITNELMRLKTRVTNVYPKYSVPTCTRWVNATINIIAKRRNTFPLVIAKLKRYDLNVLNPSSRIKNGKKVVLMRTKSITTPVKKG